MATHKLRSGAPLITFLCQRGDHGTPCDEFTASVDNDVVCHCNCHPQCQRPACLAPRVQRRVSGRNCPVHFVRLPLSGVCDQCD